MSDKLRIGQVHQRLRERFPDLELSKIRYYEDVGLVHPTRTAKGYRLYAERDVACLEEALRMVREEFLPLKVVRERLLHCGLLSDAPVEPSTKRAARVAGRLGEVVTARVADPALPVTPRPVAAKPSDAGSPQGVADVAMTANELVAASGLSVQHFHALADAGVLPTIDDTPSGRYDGATLLVAHRAADLLRQGVDVRQLVALKRTVDRELDLVTELTASNRLVARRDGRSAHAEVQAVAASVGALRDALREQATPLLPTK